MFEVFAQNGELVTAKAGDVIALAHELPEASGRFDEQLVAGGMAQRVIDLLESVEIESTARHGRRAACLASACGLFDEQLAVGQAGEWIMKTAVKLQLEKIGDAPR